jgi:hypothetical protein
MLAGPKIANFDRVEWQVMPDPATAAAALQRGEIDWWDQPIVDLLPTLRANKTLKVELLDNVGNVGVLRFNHTLPPFDNALLSVVPALRRQPARLHDRNRWRRQQPVARQGRLLRAWLEHGERGRGGAQWAA